MHEEPFELGQFPTEIHVPSDNWAHFQFSNNLYKINLFDESLSLTPFRDQSTKPRKEEKVSFYSFFS